jgi:hypothetical protein
MEEALTSIYDIQYVTDPAANDTSLLYEETVIVQGIVTGFGTFGSYNKYYVQDADGAWNGIYVYDGSTGVVLEAGDEIKLTGKVAEYYGVSEIDASKVEILSSRNDLPTPTLVTAPITEELEGILIKVEGVTLSLDGDTDDSKAFMLASKDGVEFKIFGELFDAVTFEEGKSYNLSGVVAYTYDNYRICPTGPNDIEIVTSVNDIEKETFAVYPNPTKAFLTISGLTSDVVNIKNIIGQTVAIKTVENNQINVSELNNGVYFIESNNKIARFTKQ